MFALEAEVNPVYCPSTTLYSWKSRTSGIELVLVKCPTPAVNGYFAVATEINNDSGCPHTLEHLVFMGSQKYPYKGFLDVLGNKQLSSTNAWTGKDQTVYTLSTSGHEGFLTMLPVYLDHVLNPKITDSTCLTEVYHIDGDGQERGVVFSEMQGLENTPFSLIASVLHKEMYGEGHPYSANTGGLLAKLREITRQQIAEFHKEAYSPRNLSVIVTGNVEPQQLLEVMEQFEKPYEQTPEIRRPFSDIDAAPRLEQDIVRTIEFPESDETFGEVQMGWFGTEIDDFVGYDAVEVLNYYFTAENNGKMQRELVEVADPLCNAIYLETDDYKRTLITLSLNSVPVEKLGEADATVMSLMRKCAETIDIDYLRDSIRRKKYKFISNVENDPASFAYMAIDNFLYGQPGEHLLKLVDTKTQVFDELLEWMPAQWSKFISRIFLEQPHTTIIGKPSKLLSKRQKRDKAKLLKHIRDTQDLADLRKRVSDAKAENETPIPKKLLSNFQTPDPSNISLIQSESAGVINGEGRLAEIIKQDTPPNFDLSLQFQSYDSKFVSIKMYLNSHAVDKDLLPYIDVILCEAWNLPMKLDDGTELTAEQVGLQTSRELISNSISTNAMLQELVMIEVRVLVENYDLAIKWIERAMYNVVFEPERLVMFIKKYLASISEEIRDGNSVMVASIHEHSLTTRSLRRQSEMLLGKSFFTAAEHDISKVQQDMERLCSQLFKANNIRVLVMGNIYAVKHPVATWQPLYERMLNKSPLQQLMPVPFSKEHRSELGLNPSKTAFITLCPTDSSFVSIVASAPTSYQHKDIPALTLLNVFLSVTEGPLWRVIRGEGLAYAARIYHRQELGYVVCEFYNASDMIQAYKTTRDLLLELAQSEDKFPDDEVEAAVLSFASALVLDHSTNSAAVIQKYFDEVLKNLGSDHVKKLIKDVQNVTKKELFDALHKYLLPLFDQATSVVYAVCHKSEAGPIEAFLAKEGFNVVVKLIGDEVESESEDESEEESGSESGTDETDDSQS